MKIGMICECAPGGPDIKIGKHFAMQFVPGAVVEERTMGNKANLIRECGDVTRFLLEKERCDVVFIVWDLAPAWPDQHEKRCRFNDKEGIRKSFLAAYGKEAPPWNRIVLICVEQMLEAWILADGTAVVEHVRRRTHEPPRFKEVRRPDRERDPKSRVINYFKQAGRTYNEHVDAAPIIMSASLSKLRQSESFQRLEDKLRQLAQPVTPRRR
ncbi:hypothetical protein D187_005401 [Cystobacter fuscus DSM 2262]|uniref:DUF4276 family protein n=1 Tax=Cystobacter fuscus (strain ATCC 25194 / DSM 2262 / NBRC 100088 / M29) TaxID=1242864 RepID=S9PP67_CYSF2|nr:DUF4276 family protein [Cystobacter fuscus]EPX64267.1 hypothetical protein D187_005401 [Cystobacter fuscus DSM 2262]